jgi:hypothetical protein
MAGDSDVVQGVLVESDDCDCDSVRVSDILYVMWLSGGMSQVLVLQCVLVVSEDCNCDCVLVSDIVHVMWLSGGMSQVRGIEFPSCTVCACMHVCMYICMWLQMSQVRGIEFPSCTVCACVQIKSIYFKVRDCVCHCLKICMGNLFTYALYVGENICTSNVFTIMSAQVICYWPLCVLSLPILGIVIYLYLMYKYIHTCIVHP